jgi:hypothetical protein
LVGEAVQQERGLADGEPIDGCLIHKAVHTLWRPVIKRG